MKAYVGQTRAVEFIALLEGAGVGECCVRGELPPRRSPWFYDNGAFTDFRANRPFNILRFMRDLRAIRNGGIGGADGRIAAFGAPDFVVLPDLVARGLESLVESDGWIAEIADVAPLYLAVQDGMTDGDVEALLARRPGLLAGIFVGGSLPWKRETAASWVSFAHARGLRVHVGRVGTLERVRWALAIGADSIDSSFPLWTRGRLEAFVAEVAR